MSIINFPSTPSDGQIYQAADGVRYQYDGSYQYWKFLTDTDNSFLMANNTGIIANAAFVKANIANSTADAAFGQANLANIRAMAAFANANIAGIIASSAYDAANLASVGGDVPAGIRANSAFAQANIAFLVANAAFDKANIGGGASVAVSDDPPPAPTANSLWWNSNTGKLLIYYNDGDTSQWIDAAGIEYSFNASTANGDTAGIIANAAFAKANTAGDTAGIVANAAFLQANNSNFRAMGAFAKANTAGDTVGIIANSAYVTANAAFAKANTGPVYGDLHITGTFMADGPIQSNSSYPLTIGTTGFAFFPSYSQHIAYYKKNGGYDYYWRKSDDGLPGGANETELMKLSDAGSLFVMSTAVKTAGIETIWVPATAIFGGLTAYPAAGQIQFAADWMQFRTLDFDAVSSEVAHFSVRMPKSWNEGTVTAKVVWSHAATATYFDVVWLIQGYAFSNGDAGNVTWGAGQIVTDTGGTTDVVYISDATSAITVGGSPVAEDWVMFRIYRYGNHGSDTMTIDARLHGVTIYYTTDAATDA